MEEAIIKVTLEGADGRKTAKELKEELTAAKEAAKGVGENVEKGAKKAEAATVSLKAQLKAMIAELATLPEGSKRFNEVSKAAGELKDRIGDINSRVNALSSDTKKLDSLVGAGTAIAGGFQAAQGAMALFGTDSKKVEEAIKNIIAVQGILNGIQMVANQLQAESALRMGISAAATKLAAAAQWVWNVALSANPISLIVIGVAALTAGIIAFAKPIKDFISNWENLRMVLLALLGPIGWIIIAYEKLFSEEARLEAEREKQAAEQRKREKANGEALQQRLKDLKELREAEAEAFQKRQTAFDLEIARADAEGKSSRELKLAKIQDIVDETKAILENNQLRIQAVIDYYKKQAEIRGQSEEAFIEQMKKQGVDLLALQQKAEDSLQANRDAVYQAETDLLKLKNDFRKQDQAAAQESADKKKALDEEEAKRLKELHDAQLKRLHDLQAQKNQVLDNLIAAENAYQDSLLTAQEREANAVRDKYFSLIESAEQFGFDSATLKEAQEAELLAIDQKYIDLAAEAKKKADDDEIQRIKDLAAERDSNNQKNLDTANTLLKIAEDAAVIFQGKEFARIKAKQDAGEKLTNAEIARLKRAEKVQKAFAVAQVAIDTARGISAAVAAGAGLPFPANIPAILAGVAAVIAGVAQTKALLGGESSVGAADTGGSSSSPNNVNQQIEKTGSQEANVIQAGSTLLNEEPQKVYVVESDITAKQKKVKVIEAAATFGG